MGFQNDVRTLSLDVGHLRNVQTDDRLTLLGRIRDLDTPAIAFTVKNLERYSGIRAGQVMPYKDVVLNMGGHFSRSSHSFVCPIHGLYTFSVTLVSEHNKRDTVHLQMGGRTICEIAAYDHTDDSSYSNGSGTVSMVLECPQGGVFRVVNPISGNFLDHFNEHVFSGFLLKKL